MAGKGQFSTPYKIDIPQPIAKQFGTGDYVSDPIAVSNLVHIHSRGEASGQMGEI